MQLQIEIPEDISEALSKGGQDLPRRALEALAIEGYRTRALTESQVKRMLGLESRIQVHALLQRAKVYLDYPEEDLENR
jgi:hypothetical protein